MVIVYYYSSVWSVCYIKPKDFLSRRRYLLKSQNYQGLKSFLKYTAKFKINYTVWSKLDSSKLKEKNNSSIFDHVY